MERIGPFCCFATGLGLVAYDEGAFAEFTDGPGFEHALGRNRAGVEAALGAGLCVLLTTGTAQRDYLVQLLFEPPPDTPPEGFVIAVGFGLDVPSGALCLRDAYELMDWTSHGLHVIRALIPPGRYQVVALRMDDPNGLCTLHLHLGQLEPDDTAETPAGGWVDLF